VRGVRVLAGVVNFIRVELAIEGLDGDFEATNDTTAVGE